MNCKVTKSMPELHTSNLDFASVLNPYKKKIEDSLKLSIETFGIKTPLRDACEYALTNGGKRFRPALVLMIADELGHGIDVMLSALAIEFFHTASLIADDLPCMDDDDERRNKPSLHKAYGEAIALLSSYALIAAGYECLAKNAKIIKEASVSFSKDSDRICTLALENATYNTGLNGATGGQFLDVFPPDLALPTLREIIHKKTVSLFEISFVFGWLFGGGCIGSLDKVKNAASSFGMAFQIADDLGDVEQDAINGRKVNIAAVCGLEKAYRMFHMEIESFQKSLKDLNLDRSALCHLSASLELQVRNLPSIASL